MPIKGIFYSVTDQGRVREQNEDSVLTCNNPFGQVILAVSDGMGGRNKGDYASSTILKSLEDAFLSLDKPLKNSTAAKKWLYKIIKNINSELFEKSKNEEGFKGMGATLSALLLLGEEYVFAQVGDSRIYKISTDKKTSLITEDHTYMSYLKHKNEISDLEAKAHKERHKITNAIGIFKSPNVDFGGDKYNKENFLLCSDGLYNNVNENDILSILKGSDTPERKCTQLVMFANANGGSDNIAVIIWENF